MFEKWGSVEYDKADKDLLVCKDIAVYMKQLTPTADTHTDSEHAYVECSTYVEYSEHAHVEYSTYVEYSEHAYVEYSTYTHTAPETVKPITSFWRTMPSIKPPRRTTKEETWMCGTQCWKKLASLLPLEKFCYG